MAHNVGVTLLSFKKLQEKSKKGSIVCTNSSQRTITICDACGIPCIDFWSIITDPAGARFWKVPLTFRARISICKNCHPLVLERRSFNMTPEKFGTFEKPILGVFT